MLKSAGLYWLPHAWFILRDRAASGNVSCWYHSKLPEYLQGVVAIMDVTDTGRPFAGVLFLIQ